MVRPTTPLIAVDIIIELRDHPGRIVLIERRNPPLGWALPGGFVDVGETLERAAIREAREETALEVDLKLLLGCYSRPERDPRGHTISAVFIAQADGVPHAADDAKDARVVDPAAPGRSLVFDHRLILEDYLHFRDGGERAPLRL